MEITFRPLGKIMLIAEATGLEITYAFEDLAFSEHSVFILQFDKEDENLIHLFINIECEESKNCEIREALIDAAQLQNMKIVYSGKFQLNPKTQSEEIDIEFIYE